MCSILYCNGLSKLKKTLLTTCRTLLGNMKTCISTFASALLGPDIWIVSKYDSFSTHIMLDTIHEITAYYLRRFFLFPPKHIIALHNAYYAQSHPRFSPGNNIKHLRMYTSWPPTTRSYFAIVNGVWSF